MWKLSEKPRTIKVTRKFATEFSEMESIPNDRPLSERRLKIYQKLFSEGQFRPCTWATAKCAETGSTYRINGKHTSTMLSSIDPMPEFYVMLEEYYCDTLDDVAKLYSTFDSKTQARTSRDIYLSFAGTVPSLRDLAHHIIHLAVGGCGYHLWADSYFEKPAAERAELVVTHQDFALWLHLIAQLGSDRTRHLQRIAVTAAMFATWQRDQEAASSFWSAVRDETGDSPDLPDRKLARLLLTINREVGGRVKSIQARSSTREIYIKCIHAWNAWRNQKPTTLRYVANAPIPTVA